MIGLNLFKDYFKGHEEEYVIIGGTACELLMSEADLLFRATKDIDLVLIVESLSTEFGNIFWNVIKNGKYIHIQKSNNNTRVLKNSPFKKAVIE